MKFLQGLCRTWLIGKSYLADRPQLCSRHQLILKQTLVQCILADIIMALGLRALNFCCKQFGFFVFTLNTTFTLSMVRCLVMFTVQCLLCLISTLRLRTMIISLMMMIINIKNTFIVGKIEYMRLLILLQQEH